MDRPAREELIRRLERRATRWPALYRLQVGLLAVLGYGYILFFLAISLALVAFVVFLVLQGRFGVILKVGWIAGALGVMILRALWVPLPKLEEEGGQPLHRVHAPRLFQMLDELSRSLRTPGFHQVLLDGDFNAGVAQRPRFGVVGPAHNSLAIGLPLLQALTPGQFRAVMAHELGHISGNHSRFAGWIYRLNRTWSRLLESLRANPQWGSRWFQRFFAWYSPLFDSYTFVLRRADEYVADRCAVQMTTPQDTAASLMRVEVQAHYLEREFWPGTYRHSREQPEPSLRPFTELQRTLAAPAAQEDARTRLQAAFLEETGTENTHPSLRDRLAAIGYAEATEELLERALEPVEVSAAEFYLGRNQESLTRCADLEWQDRVALEWQQQFGRAQAARQELEALEGRARFETLTQEECRNLAALTAGLRGDQAVPVLLQLAAEDPHDPVIRFQLGRALLKAGDPEGLAHLEWVMGCSPEWVIRSCQEAFDFLLARGALSEAEEFRRRARRHAEMLEDAAEERQGISKKDRFEQHGLSGEEVGGLRQQLAAYPSIEAAYLVRKSVRHLGGRPFYVLGIVPRRTFFQTDPAGDDAKLRAQLGEHLQLPGDGALLFLQGPERHYLKAFRLIAGAEIYSRRAKGKAQ